MSVLTSREASGTGTRPARTTRRAGTGRLAAALLSPTLLVVGLVIGYPVVAALRLSFQVSHQSIDPHTGFNVTTTTFGLDNYARVFGDDRILRPWWNTTSFALASVTLEVFIGMAMALVMHRAFQGRALVRAAVLVPWAIPTAMSGLLWKWIFNSQGIANDILGAQILWNRDGFQAWLSVVVADTWKTAPFIGLLVLAGLQVIPGELYEAARVDGASPWRTFWRITLPLVRPALVVAVLFRLLDVLRMFDLPYVLVGPRKHSVETLSMIAFEEMTNLRFGTAAAYATVLFAYVAVVAFAFVRLFGADLIGRGTGSER
ncbi:carbohydrate ABC transporter permease [Streptomyces sp. V3I7]|uniref:carbohydrate ABC transporter permease n=1 Tax=Streptomyces sp. V3I7 TaxID=3042278 RepID=UPI002784F90F|nr:sugar ABC transporter permease [Streptomyces sp. V3I7]MDQ0994571.1 multiple sugar transport system permease protein [Streptomyces sp. V3I7]